MISVQQETIPKAVNTEPTTANKLLRNSAVLWLVVALVGQWAFMYYLVAFYGQSIVVGDLEIWNRLEAVGAKPYIAGDAMGNFAFAMHALGASIIAFGGALQLIPAIRTKAPRFHRWNGRVFLLTVILLSMSGFYLVWVRDAASTSQIQGLSTSFNGLLILAFAWLAFRAIRARRIDSHRRWAMRLYLVANAQWFLRIGMFTYFSISQMFGFGGAESFMLLWTFGCYLVPLAMLEVYFWTQSNGSTIAKSAVACTLVALALLMCLGIFAFGMFSQLLISGAPLAF